MQGQLKQLAGHATAFCGSQKRVIEVVVHGDWLIVQVALTGDGRSLTFMLPAFCTPDGMTSVVTSFGVGERRGGAGHKDGHRCVYMEKLKGAARGIVDVRDAEEGNNKGISGVLERMHGPVCRTK
ncbi:hypothetical protein M431DRAFT_514404 [Trichoderma harzianum CBS 226.95]|uniref:Uncharacterized protein n=1 Tax=Trichoderma harzianum CBS 226.95 TaxID=983964 RepID=A0A2T3ZRG4_TRIHA|nr:hypothetical protein M431DRAFT_514404 [Trichoderma harzianum CBS 226.95]PTB47403.1 hypothetical protein M431DRAFT_514404 [Trichoderma harzianum CBS 226.95]